MTKPHATRRVRRANQDDIATLSHFRYEFRAKRREATEPESDFLARCAEWMRPRLRSDSRWRAFLLEQGREAIGNIWLQMIEKIPNPADEWELHGYITNFFVLPEHRNTGAGSLLLGAAIDDCRALHADSIFLWPSDDSKPLYLRHGFSPAASMMLMKL